MKCHHGNPGCRSCKELIAALEADVENVRKELEVKLHQAYDALWHLLYPKEK